MRFLLTLMLLWPMLASANPMVVLSGNAPPPASGGITQVAVTSLRGTALPDSAPISVTIPSTMSNGYVIVAICFWDDHALMWITDVTLGGVPMVEKAAYQMTGDTLNRIQVWGLAVGSKAPGTYPVQMEVAATTDGTVDEYTVGAVAYNGVNQTTPHGTVALASSGTAQTSSVVTVASAAGERIVDVLLQGSGNVATPTGAGHTELWDGGGVGQTTGAAGTVAGATSVNVTWSFTSQPWSAVAIPLKP